MKRGFLSVVLAGAASVTAAAHFVFVVPQGGTGTATVLLSETLSPDGQVDVGLVSGATLSLRDLSGRETPLTLAKGDQVFTVATGDARSGVVHGLADLGVMKTGRKPHVLLYHPKTILGDPFDSRHTLGALAPVELIPLRVAEGVRLQLVARGRPQGGADVTVLLPDGAEKIVKTDAEGRTEPLPARGRYGAWARFWEATGGTRNGEAYEQVRHYATLVFDAPASSTAAALPSAVPFATLREATSSFGAIASDGWMYVYGGHVVRTHVYASDSVSGRFTRMKLADPGAWETLPSGPALQGLNLAAHQGRIYRVGGMQPRNAAGAAQDIWSVADAARFDPATHRWEPLPPLPAPRSSHDVVVAGETLVALGGWNLRGRDKPEWPDHMELLDLGAATPTWRRVPQPFKRRALAAAAAHGRVYVFGGFDDHSRVVKSVAIYDIARGAWSMGPDLPGGAMSGFGPAAAVVDGAVIVSLDDGGLFRLVSDEGWEPIGRGTPRIVHRLIPDGRRVLVAGGAAAGRNFDLVEAFPTRP